MNRDDLNSLLPMIETDVFYSNVTTQRYPHSTNQHPDPPYPTTLKRLLHVLLELKQDNPAENHVNDWKSVLTAGLFVSEIPENVLWNTQLRCARLFSSQSETEKEIEQLEKTNQEEEEQEEEEDTVENAFASLMQSSEFNLNQVHALLKSQNSSSAE
jgi:hypothetical protein